jgi:hypothetical protein
LPASVSTPAPIIKQIRAHLVLRQSWMVGRAVLCPPLGDELWTLAAEPTPHYRRAAGRGLPALPPIPTVTEKLWKN